MLDGEAKGIVAAFVLNGIFYATALKRLKNNFGNPLLVVDLKIKTVFDRP